MHPIYGLVSKYQPLEFKGAIYPTMTLKWLEAIKEVMTMFTLIDQEKIMYATYLL